MSKLHFVDQGTTEWWKLRRGRPTASQFHRIVTPTGLASTQARAYMHKLIAERLLGETIEDDRYHGGWMERGTDLEPIAIERFATLKELTLQKVSFVTTDDERYGCSPDCLVKGSVEAVEIKCPAPWTQVRYLLDGPGTDYKAQVQGQMLVGGWKAVHFFAYHPQMPSAYLYTLRDEPYIRVMAEILDSFCKELDRETNRARSMGVYIPTDAFEAKPPPIDLPGVFPWRKQ